MNKIDSSWGNIFKAKDGDLQTLIEQLKHIPLFAGLSKGELKEVERLIHFRHYQSGEVIFWEDEPGVGMYVVQQGEVGIFKAYGTPEQKELARLQTGDFFGEMALLEDESRSATAVALSRLPPARPFPSRPVRPLRTQAAAGGQAAGRPGRHAGQAPAPGPTSSCRSWRESRARPGSGEKRPHEPAADGQEHRHPVEPRLPPFPAQDRRVPARAAGLFLDPLLQRHGPDAAHSWPSCCRSC